MEYTQENHYHNKILKLETSNKNCKRSLITISGSDFTTKAELDFNGESYWILKNELDTLTRMNIKPQDIKVLTYVEGMRSPYSKVGGIMSPVDGYQLDIMY